MSNVHTRTPSQPEWPHWQVNAPAFCADDYIRGLIEQQYAGHGGGAQLARKLGVSESTASVLRHRGGDLTRAAALYGYIPHPETQGLWLRVSRESLRDLAIEFGTTRNRILDRITRVGLREPVVGSLEEAIQTSHARLRTNAAERRA